MPELLEKSQSPEMNIEHSGELSAEDLEHQFDPDRFEKKEQPSALDRKIKELRDLEGLIGTLDIDFSMKDSEDQSSMKTYIDEILGRIKQGYEGKLTARDNSDDIKFRLTQGTIKEKELTDRIFNIYTDIAILEDGLKSAKTRDDVINSVQTLVDKYNKDWPE